MALCLGCRRSVLRRLNFLTTPSIRSIANVPSAKNAAPQAPPSIAIQDSDSATSSTASGASQPPSNIQSSTIPGSTNVTTPISTHIKSSVAGGQELRGIGYTKAKPHVLAKEDDQYPDWLWKLLDDQNSGEAKIDLSSMTKKQRAKYDRKQERLQKNIPKQIPIHEQSKDLTGPEDDAVTSLNRRKEITQSSRVARRKAIREDNFLRSM